MVGGLLGSGMLRELIDDPTGALLLAAVGRGVADAPSMVELLLRHGVPVTLLAVNSAVSRLNDKALEVLLAASRPPVPLGSEEEPELWRGPGEHCPLYNLLTCQVPSGAHARTAELLLAAGYRPAIYHHLVFSWRGQEDEEVVVHLHDFSPVEDLVAAQPALRAHLRDADRCVPRTTAAISNGCMCPPLPGVQPTEQQPCSCCAVVVQGAVDDGHGPALEPGGAQPLPTRLQGRRADAPTGAAAGHRRSPAQPAGPPAGWCAAGCGWRRRLPALLLAARMSSVCLGVSFVLWEVLWLQAAR